MKKIIALLCISIPLAVFAQKKGYKFNFTQIDSLFKATTAGKYNDAKFKVEEIDQAKIEITGVDAAEVANFRLQHRADAEMSVNPQALDGTTLVFLLKDALDDADDADNTFELLYKDKSVAEFLFAKEGAKEGAKNNTDPPTTYVEALAGANFVGNNKFLANLTPVVHLGGLVNFKKKAYKAGKKNDKPGEFRWDMDFNPYLGAQIDTKDSVSFIPALMLPGRAGLQLNTYLSWGNGETEFTWMPLGFGLKILPGLRDSTINIWQHNFRTAVALKHKDVFLLSAQFTYGFHNTTSESKKFFHEVFSKNATDIMYLTLTGQFKLKSESETERSNFLFLEWRGLLSKKEYTPFDNISIITLGLRKSMSLANAVPVRKVNKRVRTMF